MRRRPPARAQRHAAGAGVGAGVGVTAALLACGLALLSLPACSPPAGSPPAAGPAGRAAPGAAALAPDGAVSVTAPEAPATLVGGEAAALAVATSEQLFESAPLAVLADTADVPGQLLAATVAVSRSVPLLLVPGSPDGEDRVVEELDRLAATAVVTVGDSATQWARQADLPAVTVRRPLPSDTPAEVVAALLGTPVELVAVDGEVTSSATAAVARLDRGAAELPLYAPAGPSPAGPSPAEPSPAEPSPAEPSPAEPSPAEPSPSAEVTAPPAPAAASVPPSASAPPESPPSPDGDDPAPSLVDATGEHASELPRPAPAPALSGVVTLTTSDPATLAATATARAAGCSVHVLATPDIRSSPEAVRDVSAEDGTRVLALGDAFGPPETLTQRVEAATTGVELPGGGQLAAPGRRYVALYGAPGEPALGVLGEQDPAATVARAREVAAPYEALSAEPVVPTFEIIATVATGGAGDDGNYSGEAPIAELRPYVDAAREADVMVVLDLQPGRTDFLTQARLYEELLREPHVGLALDPEWRLAPDELHLEQIGSVDAAEVNTVVTWLADLVAEHDLPQKPLVLHQFRGSMITNRPAVDTSRDELAVIIHADGQGAPAAKLDTWRALRQDEPDGVYWGWKNFYDEDLPTMTPEETMAVEPAPVFISYQ